MTDLNDPRLFIDRELSLLDFFRRVLEEAQDPSNPLLERLFFLSIASSDLAEFFMVRVAGLKQQIDAGIVEPTLAGLTPIQQLDAVRATCRDLMRDTRLCLRDILPFLEKAGIVIVDYESLTAEQREKADSYYRHMAFPVLTPLAVDPGRPFPHISNMSLNLAVVIKDSLGQERFARIKLPASLPRFVELPSGSPGTTAFLPLEQLVAANLGSLFPGMIVMQSHPFRVTRDAEVAIQEMEAEDLLETIRRACDSAGLDALCG